MRHKPDPAEPGATPEARPLSEHRAFLEVIRDCCARGGRFTLTAQAPTGNLYTVLVDRGGPFNVSGGGLTGSDALVAAARLTSGTYTVEEGWPVAQPLYQIGLDAILRMLSKETMPTVVGGLPAGRGVDALRNANANAAAANPQPVPSAAGMVAPEAIFAEPVTEPPAVAPMTAPAPVAAERALVDSLAPPPPATLAEAPETDFLLPAGPNASSDQGGIKHLATQSLLWLVQIDEPQRYTFKQARRITTRAMASSMKALLHPFQDRAQSSWQQAKEDWEKSGEVVAKQQARRKKRVREVDVDPRQGPLSGR